MKFDDFVGKYVGECGRYQTMQLLLVSLPPMFVSIQVLSWMFIAQNPPHRCRLEAENDSWPFLLANTTFPSEHRGCVRFVKNNATLGTEECIDGYKWDFTNITYSAVNRWTLVCDRKLIAAIVLGVYFIGHFFGSPIFGFLGDRIGRKPVFFIAILVETIAGVLIAVAPHWSLIGLLRIATGFAHPGIFLISVVIGSELVGPSNRKLAGVLNGITSSIGQLILVAAAYFIRDYRYLQVTVTLPAFIFISYWWLVPESPRWLLSTKQYEKAGKILEHAAHINGRKLPVDFLKLLKGSDADEKHKSLGVIKVFRMLFFESAELRRRTCIAFFCWLSVTMIYYGVTMDPQLSDEKTDGNDLFYLSYAVGAVLEIPAFLAVLVLIDNVGRKPLLCGSCFITGICLLSTLLLPKDVGWLRSVVVFFAKGVIAAGLGVNYTYTPELFPTPIRNTVVGCCSMIGRFGGISASFLVQYVISYSRVAVMCIFGTFAVVAGLLCLLLPETTGTLLPQSLEDIDGTTTPQEKKPKQPKRK